MTRIKIELPEKFPFSCIIPIRITDMNYGGHAGNDTILSLVHEARVQYLQSLGYSEMNLGGVGIIMTDAAIEFKSELFYGDKLTVDVAPAHITNTGFDLLYKLQKNIDGKSITVARVKTGIVCFDYTRRKIQPIPAEVKSKLNSES